MRGYTGAAPMFLAMQRKEIDGQFVGMSSVQDRPARRSGKKRAFRPLVLFGRTSRHPEFPDVPTGRELTKDPAMLALIDFAEIPFFMALPFAAPPGVPADRAKALQEAFMAMCRDKAFLDEAEKLGIDMSPIDGDEILRLLARMAATPKDVIARYNALGGEKEDERAGGCPSAHPEGASQRSQALTPSPACGPACEVIARQLVEIGAGDADHPGLLRMRGRMDHAGAVGAGSGRDAGDICSPAPARRAPRSPD